MIQTNIFASKLDTRYTNCVRVDKVNVMYH